MYLYMHFVRWNVCFSTTQFVTYDVKITSSPRLRVICETCANWRPFNLWTLLRTTMAYGLAGCFRTIRRLPQSGQHLGCWFFITVPNLVQKSWSTPKLWPKNEIQNGGCRHLDFTSGRYFWHTADFTLLRSTTTQNLVPISQSVAELW